MTNKEIISKINDLHVYKTRLMVYIKNHYPDLYQAILDNTKFLDEDNPYNFKITFGERLYCIKNDITSRVHCQTCKTNIVQFKSDTGVYRKYCSNECTTHSDEKTELTKKTKLERYGSESYINSDKARQTRFASNNGKWHNDDFVEKCRKTKIDKYGSISYNNIDKFRQTCIDKYGVDHPMKNPDVKYEYFKHFTEMHNGISVAYQLPEVIQRTKDGIRRRSYAYLCKSSLVEPMFSETDYLSADLTNLRFKCKLCGNEYTGKWDNGVPSLCQSCHPGLKGTSEAEQEVFKFIDNTITENHLQLKCFNDNSLNRSLIAPKEIDIAITDTNLKPYLLIEYDGLYWHSSPFDDSKRMNCFEKMKLCEEYGYHLIHIFENEWLSKKDIVKSRIKNLIGVYDKTIYARKCIIKTITSKQSNQFQLENHIQGSVNCKINLGLFYGDELISIMTFNSSRFNKKYEWELMRFCNKLGYHIPGAAGKLLKYFERNWKPKSLISYADRRWSQGKLYKALGFELDHVSAPNYWYFKPHNCSIIYSRQKFQKHKLKLLLEKFDLDKSEFENMTDNGYCRIYDCGNLVFVKTYADNE